MHCFRKGRFACSCIKALFSKSQNNNNICVETFSISITANLKYVQFVYNNKPDEIRSGYMAGDNVVDLNKHDSSIPSTMLGILKAKGSICKVQKLKCSNPPVVPISCVTLAAPITGMDKVLCIGLNYSDHCEKHNLKPPQVPLIFSKFASSIIGQNEPLRIRTSVTKNVDWEVEMVVVIGTKCTNVKAACAFNYVFGYTIGQDISSRDWLKQNGGQFLLGKSQDNFCPLGPCIATCDDVCDPLNLDIKCSINGVVKQSSNTSNMIHKIPDIIKRLSSIMTLLPGDIILSGTPAGVGIYRKPPEFLKPGDVLRSEIQNIGAFDIKIDEFKNC